MNDDEWIHFQPIACHLLPYGHFHRQPFREWCGSKDLVLFGSRLPLRSYNYSGVSDALFFLPFWLIIRSSLALKIFTGILWFLNSFLLSSLTRVSWALSMGVVMMSAPMFSQHMIDTGPFALQFTMVLLALISFVRGTLARSILSAMIWGTLSVLPAFLAFEQKATVVFAIPAAVFLLLSAYGARPGLAQMLRRDRLIRVVQTCIPLILILGMLIWFYVHLDMAFDGQYINQLLNRQNYSWSQLSEWTAHARGLFDTFVVHPSTFFHRAYGMTQFEKSSFLQEIALIYGGLLVALSLQRKWSYLSLLTLSLFLAIVTLMIVARSTESWAGHHAVYACMIPFFGIMIALDAIIRGQRWIAFLGIGMLLYIHIPTLMAPLAKSPLVHSERAKTEIFALVDEPNFAAQHVVVHLSWGAFFQDSLLGPDSQVVTWTDDPRSPEISRLARELNRRVAYIRLKSEPHTWGLPEEKGWRLLATSSKGGWELWEE